MCNSQSLPGRGERREYLKERENNGDRCGQFIQPSAPVGQRLQASDLTLFFTFSPLPLASGAPGEVLWPRRRRLGVWELGLETKSPLPLSTQPLREYQGVCILPGSC